METTDYCSYELSKALKAAGFDEPCDCYHNGHGNLNRYADTDRINRNTNGHHTPSCSAPHIYHAQKWLREKKRIAINVDAHDGDFYTWEAVFLSNAAQDVLIEASLSAKFSPYVEKHGSYESALSAGISAALELIKQEKNNYDR